MKNKIDLLNDITKTKETKDHSIKLLTRVKCDHANQCKYLLSSSLYELNK